MKYYGTFDRVDWLSYYKVPIVVKGRMLSVDIQEDNPCNTCFKNRNCSYSLHGEKNVCFRFNKWFMRWWPIVTGQKVYEKENAAHGDATSEDGEHGEAITQSNYSTKGAGSQCTDTQE